MRTFGLTGGIGMGKSTAATLLRRRSIPVVDSDEIARQLVEPGQPALEEITRDFGAGVVDTSGRLRREELAQRVFSDPAARHRLESILHPRIREIWRAQVEEWEMEGHATAVVVIPLLFETDAAGDFDITVCVACSAATQWLRLRGRNWTEEENRQRIAAQMPAEKKMTLADFVVWTEGPMDIHEAQLRRIVD